ncbi:MAG TPA: hypothetical protein VF365_01715 [Candidatus Limnocylindria bacterium]
MARALLLAAAIVWAASAVGASAVAAVGTDTLERALPPLSIDTEALRGAIVAVAAGLGIGAAIHVAVLAGLRARRPIAWSAGILLATLMAMTFVALAAAAFTSAIAAPASAVLLLAAGGLAVVAALGYGLIAARLVAEKRAGSAT